MLDFQILIVPYIENQCVILAGNVATYTPIVASTNPIMINFYAYYQYTMLGDNEQLYKAIEDSTYIYYPRFFVSFVAPMSQTTQLTFGINSKHDIHGIYWANCPNSSVLRTNTAISSSATYYGSNCLAMETVMFPAFKLYQVQIDYGGKIVTLNSQNLAMF